jgi:phosphoribosylanthranilate isomerase
VDRFNKCIEAAVADISPKFSTGARVRVKICGITRPEDARCAVELGADAIGLVFYEPSPRAVTLVQAHQMVNVLPPFITKVGLFVDASERTIRGILKSIPLDLLQFHGDERAEDCAHYGRPYIKAFRVHAGIDIAKLAEPYREASGILLDAFVAGKHGGTGRVFDWALVPRDLPKPIILAGGLTPDNVAAAIAAVRPYAVDVSGGVEVRKGIKDPDKMRAFMKSVWSAECLVLQQSIA